MRYITILLVLILFGCTTTPQEIYYTNSKQVACRRTYRVLYQSRCIEENFYKTGQLASTGELRELRKWGTWTWYSLDGKIDRVTYFRNDIPDYSYEGRIPVYCDLENISLKVNETTKIRMYGTENGEDIDVTGKSCVASFEDTPQGCFLSITPHVKGEVIIQYYKYKKIRKNNDLRKTLENIMESPISNRYTFYRVTDTLIVAKILVQ